MEKVISPIAIDLGAKNTGVYYAHYKKGAYFKDIKKRGEVLTYGNNYTPLLESRTSNRHVSRGYKRKKLAKRLLKIILKKYFNFPVDDHLQALGFLMNRRGFSFLEENYSEEYLNKLPDEVWQILSKMVQGMGISRQNIAGQLMQFATNKPEKITELFKKNQNIKEYKKFNKTAKKIKSKIVYFDYIEKISKACKIIANNEIIKDNVVKKSSKDKKKLSETSNWIIDRLNKENNLVLKINKKNYHTDLTKEISQNNYEQIKQKLPDFEAERKKVKQQQSKNNKSIWDFNYSQFEFNTSNEKGLEENKTKTHLHHFYYAVYKINDEIMSGGRHRSKFFDEIKKDLERFNNDDFLTNEHNPKYLKEFILAIRENKELNIDKLHKLICHISNFELKPLHKYFNNSTPIEYKKLSKHEKQEYEKRKQENKEYTELEYLQEKYPENYHSHKKSEGGDKFNNKKLSRIASIWFMKHWIVTEKDGKDKKENYKELRKNWSNHKDKNNIIDFWLDIDPILTIPPYSKMFNRKPPKCQSLLLNIDYLNKHYPNWQDWLKKLGSDEDYKNKLKSLRSSKDNKLLDSEQIKLRQLQFILDTAKNQDNYKLNEIWSIHHWLQKPATKNQYKLQKKLADAIKESTLSNYLKQDLEFNQQGSFGHFLNKYYQTRRKARDGRYFLIQEKKEKWLTDGKLLTLCSHKPRQKKYQWQIDLAAILGVNVDSLKGKIGDNPEDYFKDIKGFKSNCEEAAKAQKDYRGWLKPKIYNELLNKPKGTLAKLANRCDELKDELKDELIKKTNIKELLADKQVNEFNKKIALVYKFAQIHNIVFKDRTGFSKTCPVCSTDNAFRMQENENGAIASRLSALSIRLIDGVVMRICDAIARKVAVTKWHKIKDDLAQGKEIRISLILEQNSFEFEPSLKEIKGKKVDEVTDDRTGLYNGQKVSAYSGEPLGNDGELDHIIPRTSKYGILNDKANLIYISKGDNQKKNNDTKFLNDLHNNYKKEIFGDKSDDEIKVFIYNELDIYNELEGKKDNGDSKTSKDINKEDERFNFGKYLSFINLSENQQKAFRHALFLEDSDPLKQKVINSLQNRNRAIVNGTQRYLAQCIADKIHRIARKIDHKNKGKTNYANRLEFDYFEYTAKWDDLKSTYNLRKKYGIDKLNKQPLYSHLTDAQLAFLIAADDHKNDGSMGITFAENQTVWQNEVNKETGEVLPSKLFNIIDIGEDNLKEINLSPKSSNQKIIDIEKQNSNKKQNLSKIFKRPIFKQNAIGERYKPIVRFKEKWYIGYPTTIKRGIYSCDSYCVEISKEDDIKKIESIIENKKYYQLTTDSEQIKTWTIKVINKKYKQIDKDSHKYFSKLNQEYTNNDKKEIEQIKFILSHCKYYVAKTEVIKAPHILSKFAKYTKNEWEYKKDKNGKEIKKYPFYKNWIDFDNTWRKEIGGDYAVNTNGAYDISNNSVIKKWDGFCKKRFSKPENQLKNRHQVKGKKYTMISLGTLSGTVFRVNRNNQNIYQALPLDTNLIGKDKSNFLIKHSKNIALSSKTADTDLKKHINVIEEIELNKHKIPTSIFFEEELENTKVFLNKNSVDVKNFPLKEFNKYFSKKTNGEKSIKIRTISKADLELAQAGASLLYAKKEIIDKSIKYTTRDGRVSDVKYKDQSVSFSLPFTKDVTAKIYKDSKNNQC